VLRGLDWLCRVAIDWADFCKSAREARAGVSTGEVVMRMVASRAFVRERRSSSSGDEYRSHDMGRYLSSAKDSFSRAAGDGYYSAGDSVRGLACRYKRSSHKSWYYEGRCCRISLGKSSSKISTANVRYAADC
jgi:hypothetical protein